VFQHRLATPNSRVLGAAGLDRLSIFLSLFLISVESSW
jgi:hypothetical protein